MMLRGHLMDGGCGQTLVWLDPQTFIPVRIEVERGRSNPMRIEGKRGRSHTPECDADHPVERELWTISSEQLEPSERNLGLLRIGDWPTASFELDGKRVDRDEIPPMPSLDQD